MIIVCNRKNMPKIEKRSVVIDIMRPSALSNIWSHNPNSAAKFFTKTRKEAVDNYAKMLIINSKKQGEFRNELIRIFNVAKYKNIYLMCCCYPQYCHGAPLKKFLDEQLLKKNPNALNFFT